MPQLDSNNLKLNQIAHNTQDIFVQQELAELLKSGKKLRVKAGFDPTAPDLHLGHTVLLRKLRQFQDLGHEVYFLIGDFTAAIGDPSGRNSLRPPLSEEEITANANTYTQALFKFLIPEQTTILYNSNWLNKLSTKELIKLAANATLARMLERDDFSKRYKANTPIYLHEFLYPLLQGYDSVEIQADIEIGGTDQTFNLLVGRELQKIYSQKPQVVMTLPILEGLDGVKKMSKSLGNYIGLQDSATDMFGKIMSISDKLMWRYYQLLTNFTPEQITNMQAENQKGAGLRDMKLQLGRTLVTQYFDKNTAQQEQANFLLRFQQNETPADMPHKQITVSADGIAIANLLKESGLATSTSEAMRLIKQNAVSIDDNKITDTKHIIAPGITSIYKVGKRKIAKVTTKSE